MPNNKSATTKIIGTYGFATLEKNVSRVIDETLHFTENENGKLVLTPEASKTLDTVIQQLNEDISDLNYRPLRKMFASGIGTSTLLKDTDGKTTTPGNWYTFNFYNVPVQDLGCPLAEFRNYLQHKLRKGIFEENKLSLPEATQSMQSNNQDPQTIRVGGVVFFDYESKPQDDLTACSSLHLQTNENGIQILTPASLEVATKLIERAEGLLKSKNKSKVVNGLMVLEYVNPVPHGPSSQVWYGIETMKSLENFIKEFKEWVRLDVSNQYYAEQSWCTQATLNAKYMLHYLASFVSSSETPALTNELEPQHTFDSKKRLLG